MKSIILKLFTVTIIYMHPALFAADMFESGPQRVNVLELYTSEGCSSCPPADRWLSELKDDKRLWKELIPVAFHVDYWNYIGWTDRFSSAAYTERQRRYARSKGLSTVYTPGFLLNGREWRSFFGLRRLSLDDSRNAGELKVEVEGSHIQATYKPSTPAVKNPILNIALLGFDLTTEVKAGENRGEQLKHDFTVLGYVTVPMSVDTGIYTAATQLPKTSASAPRTGITTWISAEGDQTPVQATGGWLNN